mgnify:CR=1 FL=1
MKEKKLLRALGNVDNQYIKEAEPMKKTSKITNRQKAFQFQHRSKVLLLHLSQLKIVISHF